MFCLRSRSNNNAKFKELSKKDDFGWWLSDEDDIKSPRSSRSKDCQSLDSSESMLSCIDSDDGESYFLAQEFKQECNKQDNSDGIELTSLIHNDMDVNLIEQDAVRKGTDATTFPMESTRRYLNEPESKSRISHGVCYTPERLVRSHEYRILSPSPRCLSISQARIMPENENRRKASRCRRQLNCLIDSKQADAAQLKALLEPGPKEIVIPIIARNYWKSYKQECNSNDGTGNIENETKKEDTTISDGKKSSNLHTPDSISKRSSYERLNITWEDCGKMGTRTSSLEDTSGIQSNWSSDTHSDLQSTPLCLSDELAATNYKLDVSQERYSAINEVVSILKVLDTDPERAAVLLEEDRFCTSSHDQLTRLALTIETDANVSGVHEDPESLVSHLQSKVKKLEANNKDIYRDIYDLRKSFQCDEQKMDVISSDANKLRQDIHELRYLDDLLNLLRGELERISKRNWPFVVGRTSHHSEEMNLIV